MPPPKKPTATAKAHTTRGRRLPHPSQPAKDTAKDSTASHSNKLSLHIGPVPPRSRSRSRSMSPPSAGTGSSRPRSRSRSGSRTSSVTRSAISGARVAPLHPGAGHATTNAYSAQAAERAHRRVLASHLAFTQIELPPNLPLPAGITKITSTVEPISFSDLHSPLLGAYSTHGDHHGSADRCEDALVAFDLHFDPTRIPTAAISNTGMHTNLPASKTQFRVAALLDGHGANVPTTQRRHGHGSVAAAPGALLVALVVQLLPEFMDLLIHLDQNLLQSTCIYDAPAVPDDASTPDQTSQQTDYTTTLHHTLCHLRDLLNAYLVARRPASIPTTVLDEAGCTLCLTLHYTLPNTPTPIVFALNIGDSSMLLLDPTVGPSGTLLPAWSTDAIARPACPLQSSARARFADPTRPAPAPMHLTAAYEDSVAAYPHGVEGQHPLLLAQDMAMVHPYVVSKRRAKGYPDRVLAAPGTAHRLRMVNAVANLEHHSTGAFVPRTLVYRVDAHVTRACLLVLVSDGVRDVVRDSGAFVGVARAVRGGAGECVRLVDAWAAAVNRHLQKTGSRSRIATGGGGGSGSSSRQPRTSRTVTQLTQIAHVFSPTRQAASSRAVAAAHRLAELFCVEVHEGNRYLETVAECLVQLAVMRGTTDDATCLLWRVGREQQAVSTATGIQEDKWWAVSAAALVVLRTEE